MEQDGLIGNVDDINMVKRGESCIHLAFRRNMGGLTINVKTHPLIEEFFRGVSTEQRVDVRTIGRHWFGTTKDTPLMAYNLAEPLPIIQLDGSRRARFDWLSRQLIQGSGGNDLGERSLTAAASAPGGIDINLAFLRLVGIGEGTGATFNVKGVYSDSSMKFMRDNIADAARAFYMTYMRPVNLSVAIITQEW